mgnify:CR=1 FL=1
MPPRSRLSAAAARAVSPMSAAPRGIAVRAKENQEAAAAAAVQDTLPGWQVREVPGLPGRFEAIAPAAADRTGPPLTHGEVWTALRAVRQLADVTNAEPLFTVSTPRPPSAMAADHFAAGLPRERFGVWGLPYPRSVQARLDAFTAACEPGGAVCGGTPRSCDWHLHQLHVCAAWTRWRERHPGKVPGEGIVIGHPDTGFTAHHEVSAVLLSRGKSFLQDANGNEEADAFDDLSMVYDEFLETPGHGTATACVIASGPDDRSHAAPGIDQPEAYGVAPGARVLPLRVSRSVLHLDFGNLARAIAYGVDEGVDVISMSLGGPWYSDYVRESIAKAHANGVIVVAAAGNFLPATAFPAALPEVIGVAATNVAETAWRFSGIGRLVDIAAPGEAVWRARAEASDNGPLFTVTAGTGTSFATACVAGLAALWLSFHGGREQIAARYGGNRALVPFAFQLLLGKTARTRSDLGNHPLLEFAGEGKYGPGIADAEALLTAGLPALADVQTYVNTIAQQPVNKLTFLAGLFSGGRAVTDTTVDDPPLESQQLLPLDAQEREAEDARLRGLFAGIDDALRDELHARLAADLALLSAAGRWRPGESRLPLLDRLLEPRRARGAATPPGLSPDLGAALVALRERETATLPIVHRGTLTPGVATTLPAAGTNSVSLPPEPAFRMLHAYSFDPSLETSLQTAPIHRVTIPARWEAVAPGPIGEYLEIVDIDPPSGALYSPVDLDHPHLLAQDGLPPSEGNPQFHQQMVYAVAMNTIHRFELALGRPVFWSPLRPWSDDYPEEREWFTPEAMVIQRPRGANRNGRERWYDPLQTRYVQRLRVYPHALREANAYYSPSKRALLFGYFPSDGDSGKDYPGGTVFTCLSHDIIAHEVTHALVDGMHPYFNEPSNDDVWAFHEAFADIMALFQHFTYPEVLRHQIANTRGDLETENLLGQLAQQFGQATGQRGALRNYLGKPNEQGVWERTKANPRALEDAYESHERGSILVAAVFDAFLALYNDRISDLLRISTGGTGVLPAGQIHPDLANRLASEAAQTADDVLRVCIRAMDYLPPVDVTFGEFLRALITADYDLSPAVRRRNRVAFIEAFRAWGIYPRDVSTLSEESLRWRGVEADSKLNELIVGSRKRRGARRTVSGLVDALEGWQPGTCRDEVFRKILTAQAGLHTLLAAAGEEQPDLVPGLDLRRGKRFSVGNLRPARRIGPLGEFRTEMAVEIVQTDRTDRADGDGLPLRGGATLIVDLNTWEIRYIIAKSLYRELPPDLAAAETGPLADRLLRRLAAARERPAWRGEAAPNRAGRLAATYRGARRRQGLHDEPFALLHRGF